MNTKQTPLENGQSQLTVDAAYTQAINHINSERYMEAGKLCAAILNIDPNHIDAINLLGFIAQKFNRHDLAVGHFQRAIDIDNSGALLFYNMAGSLDNLGRREEAIQSLKTALEKEPGNVRFAEYLNTISNNPTPDAELDNIQELLQRGISHHQAGRLDEAIHWYRKLLEIQPATSAALSNLGAALQDQGKLDEAIASYQKAISIKPDHAKAHSNLGNALKGQKRFDEAVASYQKAISIEPGFVEAHNNLGVILREQGKLDDAVLSHQKAISIKPDYATTYSNLGHALTAQGKLDEAVASYQKAISIEPGFVEAHNNLGNALTAQGKLDEAVASHQKAISIAPGLAEAHDSLGYALTAQGKLDEAIASHQKAILIQPDYINAYINLGIALKGQGKVKEAVASQQKALYLRLNHNADEDVPADFPGSNIFFIELTNRCNFHCSFCPSDDQTRSIGEMSLGLVEKIFNEISSKKLTQTVNLHQMGEPTLYRHLKEVLNMASRCGLKVDLVTNGSTLNKGNIDFLLSELYGKLIISLQTPTIDSFELRGTKMLWENYIRRIQDLVEAYLSRVAHEEPLKCKIQIRLMKTSSEHSNVDVLSDKESILYQINYWSDLISSIELREGLTPYPRKQLDLLSDDWFSQNNSNYALQTNIALSFRSNFTFANTIVHEDTSLTYSNNTKFCSHPFLEISILWDGRCVPCCLDYDGQLDIGNANTDSLESILVSAKASRLRKAFLGDGFLPEYCRKCQADLI
jgi:tetratricopeptide (TPR) repeat protein